MTFDAKEQATLGYPTEAYEFVQGGTTTRVTSSALDEVLAGATYTPLAGLRRSAVKQQGERGAGEINIDVPISFPIALQFRGTLPSSLPNLTIYQRHNDDGATPEILTYWKGVVVSCEFGDQVARLTAWDAQHRLRRPLPRRVYSGVCNHQLFDPLCAVAESPYTAELVIAGLTNSNRTLQVTGLRTAAGAINTALGLGLSSGELDTFWMRGKIQLDVTAPELRMVIEANVGADPDKVRIPVAFRDVTVGDTIFISAGCNHSPTHCSQKFKNFVSSGSPSSGIRIGGFPYVPTNNPFNIDISTGMSDNTRTGSLFKAPGG